MEKVSYTHNAPSEELEVRTSAEIQSTDEYVRTEHGWNNESYVTYRTQAGEHYKVIYRNDTNAE